MVDGGVGISAAVTFASNFVKPSTFVARHDSVHDKESEKSVKLAERFGKIPNEDIDHFEFEEYNLRHSKSLDSLKDYRCAQEEYKAKSWIRNPVKKWEGRTKVRKAKRQVQSSIAQEQNQVEELETHSRRSSACGSQPGSHWGGSESGLNLNPSRPYRTDSCSIRATGGSPPSASMEDICTDEMKAQVVPQVLDWLSSVSPRLDSTTQKPTVAPTRLSRNRARQYLCEECQEGLLRTELFCDHFFDKNVGYRTNEGLYLCLLGDCIFQTSVKYEMFLHFTGHADPVRSAWLGRAVYLSFETDSSCSE